MYLGINGFKGSGKDTVGSYLAANYGYKQVSFAKLLKESAAALFDVDPSLWEELKNDDEAYVALLHNDHPLDHPRNISSMSVRVFLQRYGTEAHRDIFGHNFWVDFAMKNIDPWEDYVFTDARFVNELKAIRAKGGYTIEIRRPGVEDGDTHASEVPPPADLIDYIIDNDGTIDQLYIKVANVLHTIYNLEGFAPPLFSAQRGGIKF